MKKTFAKRNLVMAVRDLVLCAMLAAVYTTLCLVLAPFSYGPVQVRVAEALALTPVFSPLAIWGVTVGCALSNLIGFMLGINILGFLDVFFGTAATLIAAVLSYKFRNVRVCGLPVLSAVPPVIVNAIIIGLELTYVIAGKFSIGIFAINAAYVGVGQIISCFVLGLPMVYILEKTGIREMLNPASK